MIYLLEYYIWNIQYVGKSDTAFNIRLNNHGKNVKNPNATPAIHYHRSTKNIHTTSAETLKERLKQRENLWILKLETLAPHGLN